MFINQVMCLAVDLQGKRCVSPDYLRGYCQLHAKSYFEIDIVNRELRISALRNMIKHKESVIQNPPRISQNIEYSKLLFSLLIDKEHVILELAELCQLQKEINEKLREEEEKKDKTAREFLRNLNYQLSFLNQQFITFPKPDLLRIREVIDLS